MFPQLRVVLWLSLIFRCCLANGLLQASDIAHLEDDDGMIRVTEENYQLLKNGVEGDYSVLYITIYTKDEEDNYRCPMCLEFEESIHAVKAIIDKQRSDVPVRYYIVDAYQVPSLIREMGIQNAPHLVVYPPPNLMTEQTDTFSWFTGRFYQYQITPENAGDVLQFGNFLAQIANIYIEIEEPFDTQKFLQYFVGSMVLFVSIKKLLWPIMKKGNASKIIMMLLSFGIMLPSLTGYKFTQINRIPFIARNDDGEIMFFSGGTGWQFGIEVFTVSLMYVGMGSLFVLLIALKSTPVQSRINDKVDNLLTLAFASALFYAFSYYISCFEVKSPGYPFWY